MATTVSERPQTRRSATGWRNPWLLLTLAGLCVGFAAQSRTMWLTLLVAALLAGFYTKAARPRLRSKITGDNVIIDRPPDWAPPSAKLYREGRTEYAAHVARARYDDTKELIASFGQITWPYLRYVAGPSIASKVVRLLDIASSYQPRRSHFVAAGAIAAMLMGMIAVQVGPVGLSNISLAAGLFVAAVAAMLVVSYFLIPNPSTTEGGRVMSDDADTANKHDVEASTSASEFQRPDGREDTPTNITRQSILAEMPKAAGTFVGTDTVGMSIEEIAAEMAAPPQHDVLTEARPDADDPLGLGSIDADLAGLIGADLPPEPPVGSPSPSWDDDVVSTGSRPTEGDTSAAHWAAEASQADDTGELPSQAAQEPAPTLEYFRRNKLMFLIPTVGMATSLLVYWFLYKPFDGLLGGASLIFASLLTLSPFWIEIANAIVLAIVTSARDVKSSVKSRIITRGFIVLVMVIVLVIGLLSLGVWALDEKTDWFQASMLLDLASLIWSVIVAVVSWIFSSIGHFYTTLVLIGLGRCAWVTWDWWVNKIQYGNGIVSFGYGVLNPKERTISARSVTNYQFDPPWRFGPLKKIGRVTVLTKESESQAFSVIELVGSKDWETRLKPYLIASMR